jgi:hypothetical protein
MLMRTQASVTRRAHKNVHRLRRVAFRTFNLEVSALDQVWCVTSMSLSLTTNKELVFACATGGRPRRRGGVPRGRSTKGATRQGAKRQGGEAPSGRNSKGAKRYGTMESSRGHRASRSDDGDELERSDEGWLDDGASAGTPC